IFALPKQPKCGKLSLINFSNCTNTSQGFNALNSIFNFYEVCQFRPAEPKVFLALRQAPRYDKDIEHRRVSAAQWF
ncbi:MAG: hypothetical protein SPH45_04600, partial [Gemmiger qucibialis]|nr:hypothetical protein [Gemmiger qucibialis]